MPRVSYSPCVLVDTSNLPEEEWLEWRRKGIGGSDAAAILGISPFATARDLYYDKLKILPFEEGEDNWVAKKMGHLLEDLVAEIFSKKTGYRIFQVKKMFHHPMYPWMLADVDYFVELPDGTIAILEIKTTNYNAKDHWWRDGEPIVPINYETQGRHYMCVTNIDRVFYCCLYGNNEDEVIIRDILRDYDYEDELIALETGFWHGNVLAHVPPPYTEDGDLILNSVKKHFGPADVNAPEVTLSMPLASCVLRFTELQAQKRELDAEAKALVNEMRRLQGLIVAEMGRCCTAQCSVAGNSFTVTYKPSQTMEINKDSLLRLQAQHPEIYEEYVTASVSRRFYVKRSLEEAA
jgi:putative phage-type endonuclease